MPSTAKHPYLICEIANVHGGDQGQIMNLISLFGEIKYPNKGIKLQVFKPDRIALTDYKWYPVYEELFFDESTWNCIIQKARELGDVWIDVFDTYSVDVLENNLEYVYGIKLQASILQNLEVFDRLSKLELTNKHFIINVSGFELDEIHSMLNKFQAFCTNIIIQIGFQSYPTSIANTALQKIAILNAAFPGIALCMADHADASSDFALQVPVYAALLGCEYIEKHFCLSRESSKYDGFSSLEPAQMNQLCKFLEDAYSCSHGKFICDAESDYLKHSVQIPVLRKEVPSGSLVSLTDLIYRRTNQEGLNDSEIKQLQQSRMILDVKKSANSSLTKNDFRPARIAAIVAGRMKSTRLPNKAILPIAGVPSVERCLEQCTGFRGVAQVILATSDLETDSILEKYNLGGRATVWKGHPDDVIGRYLTACREFNIDIVIRATADCPLLLPEIIDFLLEEHLKEGADYTAAKECAVGTSAEIINTSALQKVADYFGKAEYSEYMTWYFQNNPEFFKINITPLPDKYVRNYRMTLDYAEDLAMFEALLAKLPSKDGIQNATDVFAVLDANPDIVAMNSHLTLKYRTDKELITLLNEKTKMQ